LEPTRFRLRSFFGSIVRYATVDYHANEYTRNLSLFQSQNVRSDWASRLGGPAQAHGWECQEIVALARVETVGRLGRIVDMAPVPSRPGERCQKRLTNIAS